MRAESEPTPCKQPAVNAMRVIYLHQYFNTPDMPGSTRSYEMARRLAQRGHDVHMVTAWREPTRQSGWFCTQEAGIHVHWLPVAYSNRMGFGRRLLAFARFAWSAARKSASLRGDVIFATSTPLTIAFPAIYAAWRTRAPMVFEARDMWPDVPIALGVLRNPLLIHLARQLEKLAHRRAGHIIVLAPGMKQDIVAKGIAAAKVSVIPNGCDVDLFRETTGTDPRQNYPAIGSRPLMLYAGTIGKANGADYLVGLAKALHTLDPTVCILAIGDGAEKERLLEEAEAAGVLGRNVFHLEPMPKRQIVAWLKTADMHIALMRGPWSYTKDAVNNKFFDAVACGKPIANNFDGWQSRVALESDIGIMLDPVDYAAAAKQAHAALCDQPWREAVPTRAAALAQGTFNRDYQAAELEQVLANAVAKSRRMN